MNVTKLVPEGVRIELTDDEVRDLLDVFTYGTDGWVNSIATLRREIINACRTPDCKS